MILERRKTVSLTPSCEGSAKEWGVGASDHLISAFEIVPKAGAQPGDVVAIPYFYFPGIEATGDVLQPR